MDSRKKAALYEKLEQLRSATNSTAVNEASIVIDASRYIEELKEKVEKLNQDIGAMQSTTSSQRMSSLSHVQVKVTTLVKGFLINVFSEKNCPGLFVSILEAFEELGLEVLDARVSCSDKFNLEAISENDGQSDSIDAQVVKQAVVQAIRNWSQNNDQD
ncbi:hypothetical protein ACJIZ3_019048 [Penstemon smallii]|uniref:Plant bHLH transcription factor ACT-like domain-containing protein n=1 Tax=Penstemon smallii TaxID=265156 RepID=A0ABD3T0X1_9LAMI